MNYTRIKIANMTKGRSVTKKKGADMKKIKIISIVVLLMTFGLSQAGSAGCHRHHDGAWCCENHGKAYEVDEADLTTPLEVHGILSEKRFSGIKCRALNPHWGGQRCCIYEDGKQIYCWEE